MFKFDFDIEDADEALGDNTTTIFQKTGDKETTEAQPFSEIPISQLLDALPSLISYSPLSVPLSSGKYLNIVRRDLFDARFQLISESEGEPKAEDEALSALDFIEAPSDLIPGVYEGGLKTWECSIDLVDHLSNAPEIRDLHGKRVLEIGCGTAIPSLYLLLQLFSSNPGTKETHIHLQDYNTSVLELVTLPNVLLNWYMSSSAAAYHETQDSSAAPDPCTPSELPITSELKQAFLQSLKERKISIRFFSGSWETFEVFASGGKYNIVLTSETMYETRSLPWLITLMKSACEQSLEDLASSQLSLKSHVGIPCLCLVAAKVLYFGVGGGVAEFLSALKDHGGQGETVWEQKQGVGRKIIQVRWNT
ncbi:hypothetical protein BDZ94DRAFT_1058912 [Collybia nuda]|uniref:protein-histidine N-methyltransferase n=1 Tax=Collybia nuda TaxID=64659 RepID=A0A9P6CB63_9AGAR|nr:hypothetical protein BDZ94DRAFT_1058912 [Collybia nuda]